MHVFNSLITSFCEQYADLTYQSFLTNFSMHLFFFFLSLRQGDNSSGIPLVLSTCKAWVLVWLREAVFPVTTWYLNHCKTGSVPVPWHLLDNILLVIQRKGSRAQSRKENTSGTEHFVNLRSTLLTFVPYNIKNTVTESQNARVRT